MNRARRIDQLDERSPIREAFIRALEHRVDTRPFGTIVLPTGRADAGEVARVLRALERVRPGGRE